MNLQNCRDFLRWLGAEGRTPGDPARERSDSSGQPRHPDLRVRPGGGAPLLSEMVPRQSRVFPTRAQRESHHQNLPLPRHQHRCEYLIIFVINPGAPNLGAAPWSNAGGGGC
jgi:hypothetical protein